MTLRNIQIWICEALVRFVNQIRPSDYELEIVRKAQSDAAREARRTIMMNLREPSRKMLEAAANALARTKRPDEWVSVREKHRIRYQAMIDAAIKPSQTSGQG